MPFDKQIEKLIGDGINLLAPSDMIAPGEAEKCVNWRVDQAAKLLARGGTRLLNSGYEDWVHDIFVVEYPPTNTWYVGAGGTLYNYVAAGLPPVAVAGGFKSDFFGLASMHGYLWVMNQAKRGRAIQGVWHNWLPDPPSATPAVAKIAGNLSGAVKYYVTFDTAKAYESNPTTVAGVITASAEISDTATFGVRLSNIPVSSDPDVTKRHIYRIGGLLPSAYRVRTINDNTTTTIDDDGGSATHDDEADMTLYFLTDAQAIDVGQLMEDDHDPPPAAFGLAGPYNERLIAFNSAANPNRIWYTPSGEPWRFRGSSSDDGDWVDVGETLDGITAISVKPHMLNIYKSRSVWRLVGDFEDGTIEQISDKTGLKGPRAWSAHGLMDYFRGNEGIYVNTGERVLKVSDKVDPIFKGQYSGVVDPTKPLDDNGRYYEAMGLVNDRLYFAYKEQ